MINIAIVEDQNECAAVLEKAIVDFSVETNEAFSIERFRDGDEIAENFSSKFDVIFLDIEMKRLNGVETAKYIRKFDKNVVLIFITSMAQHAIDGYSVEAKDFLVKPLQYSPFSITLKRVLKNLHEKQANYILFPSENGIIKIDINSIVYIESFKHEMIAHTKEKEQYTISVSMSKLEKNLKENNFVRVGKSYLVNLRFVKGIKKGEVLLSFGTNLIIGRIYKAALLDSLTKYVATFR